MVGSGDAVCRLAVFSLLALTGMGAARAQGAGGASPAPDVREIVPATTDQPLVNPGMGLYLFGTLNPGDMPAGAWFQSFLNIGYFRDDWSKLEPDAEGQYKFDEYFKPIFDLWVNRWGKRVAFRFMSSNMHSQQKYVTPKWVFDAGVPGVVHKGVYVPEQVDPVFWDDHYLRIQERFIADLGKYLDGRPGLEFIDIGSIGEWGEMHLARWTPAQLQAAGFTREKYISAYRRIIDAFGRAFPHTRVFLNVGDYWTINDYAAIHHVNFRQDGLNPSGPSSNVGKRFYIPYSRRGVICNYELYSGYDEMMQKGWGLKATFDKGLEDPISYLHINLMSYPRLLKAPEEVKAVVTDAARRIGFRFVLTDLKMNPAAHVGPDRPGRLLLDQTWKNQGVAPCYDSYALRWSLVDANGHTAVEQLQYPTTPTTQWWPGDSIAETSTFEVPAGTPPGQYHLVVTMVRPDEPALRIQLGLAGKTADGGYDLGTVTVAPAAPGSSVAYQEGFENGPGDWHAAAGIIASVSQDAHTGHSSLHVEGTQPGSSWNYVGMGTRIPLERGARYRLSGWMKVDRVQPASNPPYLKIGVYDSAGKWISNFNTNPYDMAHPGTWQLLETYADVPANGVQGDLSVEKGAQESKPQVALELDDVRLEMVEGP